MKALKRTQAKFQEQRKVKRNKFLSEGTVYRFGNSSKYPA